MMPWLSDFSALINYWQIKQSHEPYGIPITSHFSFSVLFCRNERLASDSKDQNLTKLTIKMQLLRKDVETRKYSSCFLIEQLRHRKYRRNELHHFVIQEYFLTRVHSSRMCTDRWSGRHSMSVPEEGLLPGGRRSASRGRSALTPPAPAPPTHSSENSISSFWVCYAVAYFQQFTMTKMQLYCCQ